MSVIHTAFVAGLSGGWRILRVDAVVGESLAMAGRLAVAGPGEAQSTATPGV